MEIDTRIVFALSPVHSGIANGMMPGLTVCTMQTMGDLLAELAGDTTVEALHSDVIEACEGIELMDLDPEFLAGHNAEVYYAMLGGR